MEIFVQVVKVFHVFGFIMMSVPLFNLIVVNERASMGASFNYATDRYMENIIRHGALRCYVFQLTVLISGVLLLAFGPLGIHALWDNWVIVSKTIILFVLTGLLSLVHFRLQPEIEARMASIGPNSAIPEGFAASLKPYRVRRKQLATACLFLVLTSIILGLQVYGSFNPFVTMALIFLAAVFSIRVNKTLILFGWA
jgi:hypothetical protein